MTPDNSPGYEVDYDADSVTTRACNAAIEAANASLEADDAESMQVLVLVHAKGVPDDERDSCLALNGFATPSDVLAELLAEASLIADHMGIALDLISIPNPGQG